MPKVTRSVGFRVVAVIAIYALIVAAAALAFQSTREPVSSGPHLFYIIFGPALSLFTHMSYILFAYQTLLLMPWLLLSIVGPRAKRIAILGFYITWIGIGWYMHELF